MNQNHLRILHAWSKRKTPSRSNESKANTQLEFKGSSNIRTMGNQRTYLSTKRSSRHSGGNLEQLIQVGDKNDPLEKEADNVADAVVFGKGLSVRQYRDSPKHEMSGNIKTKIHRKCASCEQEEDDELKLHRKESSSEVSMKSVSTKSLPVLSQSGSVLPAPQKDFFESRLNTDFAAVRIHTGASAARDAKSLNARAFTFGNNIVFGENQYRVNSRDGMHLLAHELTHVLQQKRRGRAANLLRRSPLDTLEGESPEEAFFGEISTLSLLTVPERVDILGSTVNSLVNRLGEELSTLRRSQVDSEALFFVESWLRRTRRTAADITENGLQESARSLSIYLEEVTEVLRYLEPLISSMEGDVDSDISFWQEERVALAEQAEELLQTPFIQAGIAEENAANEVARQDAIIAGKVARIRDYLRRQHSTRSAVGIHGSMIANILVNDEPRLNAEQVRNVFNSLFEIDPELLDEALYEGRTVQELLGRGLSGFQAYMTDEEGFLSGVIRGERESLLANPAAEREFNVAEQAIAGAAGVAGFLQGVGDSLISNIKAIIDLFTPSFWSDLYTFLSEFLPNFVMENGFRFLMGQMMGQTSADEVRRLGTASPFEYGRTIGHAMGFALTEVVLSFVGLGWILKAFRGTRLLAKVSEAFMPIIRRLGRSAIVAKGFNVAQSIGASLNALRQRLQSIRNRLPAITAEGRMTRAIGELEASERAAAAAVRRAEALEQAAQRALSSGDNAAAQTHLDDLSKVLDELDDLNSGGSARVARESSDVAQDASRAERIAARNAEETVGGVNPETRDLLLDSPRLREAVERYPNAARAFKFCNSPCLPPIPPATLDDYARFDAMLERAEEVGLNLDLDRIGEFFHQHQDDLPAALDVFEDGLMRRVADRRTIFEMQSAPGSSARLGSNSSVADSTRTTRHPEVRDPTDSLSTGAMGEVARHAEVGRAPTAHSDIVTSALERRRALDRLYDTSDTFSLTDFATRFGNDGATQVYLRSPNGGGRFIDHMFIDGNSVVLRESKTVAEFSDSTKILAQMRKDIETLNAFSEARVRWRVTVNSNDVSAEFMTQIRQLVANQQGRFVFEFNDISMIR